MNGRLESAPAARPPVALYVHVPFCLSVCPYCDFVVYAGAAAKGPRSRVDAFVDGLVNEIALRAADDRRRFGTALQPLRSVYLGGGTPSLLAASTVARVLRAIDDGFGVADDAEITIETNPGPKDRGDIDGFRAAGVDRISIGVQSFDAMELTRLGRRHTAVDAMETIAIARRARFRSISVDLLYDVPGQTEKTWTQTMRATLDAGVDHVSAYALTLSAVAGGDEQPVADHLPASVGALRWRRRATADQDDDRAADQYELADRLLSEAGLRWYELSNWARPRHESGHNLVYWTGQAFEAVGPGAYAFDGRSIRRWNAALLEPYLAALTPSDGTAPRLPPGGTDVATQATATADQAILALRLRRGLARADPLVSRYGDALAWGGRNGLVEMEGNTLRLTLRGRLLSNSLFAEIA